MSAHPDFTPDENWNPLAREYFNLDADEFNFEVSRSPEKAIDRAGRTFSRESLDYMFEQITFFIGARLAKRWNKAKPPIKMRVMVKVEFGDPNQREDEI